MKKKNSIYLFLTILISFLSFDSFKDVKANETIFSCEGTATHHDRNYAKNHPIKIRIIEKEGYDAYTQKTGIVKSVFLDEKEYKMYSGVTPPEAYFVHGDSNSIGQSWIEDGTTNDQELFSIELDKCYVDYYVEPYG